MSLKGTCRVEHPDGVENGVWVRGYVIGYEVTESGYVRAGLAPALETLPWRPAALEFETIPLQKLR